jgi:hypothetical protein
MLRGLTERLSCWVADMAPAELESVTFKVKVELPAGPVGVPEIVFPVSVKPAGSVPEPME